MYTYNNTTHNAQQCSLLSRSTAWRVRSKTWNIALPGIAEAIKGSKPPHYHFHGIAQQSHLVISASRWRLSKVSFEEITLGWATFCHGYNDEYFWRPIKWVFRDVLADSKKLTSTSSWSSHVDGASLNSRRTPPSHNDTREGRGLWREFKKQLIDAIEQTCLKM